MLLPAHHFVPGRAARRAQFFGPARLATSGRASPTRQPSGQVVLGPCLAVVLRAGPNKHGPSLSFMDDLPGVYGMSLRPSTKTMRAGGWCGRADAVPGGAGGWCRRADCGRSARRRSAGGWCGLWTCGCDAGLPAAHPLDWSLGIIRRGKFCGLDYFLLSKLSAGYFHTFPPSMSSSKKENVLLKKKM